MPFRPDQVQRVNHHDTVFVYLYHTEHPYVFHKSKYEQLQHWFQTADHRACLEIEGFYGHLLNFMRGDVQIVMYSSLDAKERHSIDVALTETEEQQYGDDD